MKCICKYEGICNTECYHSKEHEQDHTCYLDCPNLAAKYGIRDNNTCILITDFIEEKEMQI